MSGTLKTLAGPAAMANAAANIFTPSGGSALIMDVMTHITIVNKTAAAATASLFIGATGGSAADTEFWVSATSVPANAAIHWYGRQKLTSTTFLSGLASAATTLTIIVEGEQIVI